MTNDLLLLWYIMREECRYFYPAGGFIVCEAYNKVDYGEVPTECSIARCPLIKKFVPEEEKGE